MLVIKETRKKYFETFISQLVLLTKHSMLAHQLVIMEAIR